MSHISLDHANSIIATAFAKGRELGLKPLSVAVLDAGGHLIAFQRQDGASTLRPQIACGKAGGALALGVSSRTIGTMAVERPTFIASVSAMAPQGMVPAAGGVIVVGANGTPIGAVGVTGDTSDNDEICALAGIAAAGLTAQP
ncbi:GlcG/HbpS family heme-binding protein [Sphingobium estronivorans]|uniref:GlcG/HbpS family heme-binding protein n=1 Tax=Sphingobium estronivorans TaxID=1577690 RepID=UPI00123AF33D|nr:heme-binding protein [Sphingobium estronivorans]